MPKFEIVWGAPEFEYREKDVSWYWISIIAAALFVAFAVWFRNFLFGFFIVIAEILFIVWGNRTPRHVAFQLDDEGLSLDNGKFYPMKAFESWSDNKMDETWHELYFHFRSRVKPSIRILFPAERIEELQLALKPLIKEIEFELSFIDAIEKILRF